jgi:hypothetical protein
VTPPAASQATPKVESKTKKSATVGSGPGGDDDRPVTMLGGSIIVTWADPLHADQAFVSGVYQYSKIGAVNEIDLSFRDRSDDSVSNAHLFRKNGAVLSIDVEHGGSNELNFSTDTNGKKLTLTSQYSGGGSNGLSGYIPYWKYIMEHPLHDKKITKLTFTGVVPDGTMTLPTDCVVDASDRTKVTCTPKNHPVRTVLIVHSCAGASCKPPK